MVSVCTGPDVADGLRLWLSDLTPGIEVTAGTTPTKFAPVSVNFIRTGGSRRDMVTDVAVIVVDVRDSASEVAAETRARAIEGELHAAAILGQAGPLTVYEVVTMGAPYLNPDPSNPAWHRVSATFQVAVRSTTTTR